MTISSEVSRNAYPADGVQTVFNYTFRIDLESDLDVYFDDVVQSTGFIIAGVGNDAGGTVTFTVAPEAPIIVTLDRDVPITQETDYTPFDKFPAETHEAALDKLTMICQQLASSSIDQTYRVPVGDTQQGDALIVPNNTDRANKTWTFDEAGAIQMVSTPDSSAEYVTTTDGNTPRTLANRFNWPINVRDRGAVGNGAASDDWDAIQNAMASMVAGSVMYFPATPGGFDQYYNITDALTLSDQDGCVYYGDGMRASTIQQATAGKDIFASGVVTANAVQGTTVRDLNLQGNQLARYGMNWEARGRSVLTRVNITSCTEAGLRIHDTLINEVLHCHFTANKDGIMEIGSSNTGPNGWSFIGNTFETNTQYAINISELRGSEISGNTIESQGNGGIRIDAGGGLSIYGNYFELNNINGEVDPFDISLGISTWVRGVDIKGNFFSGDSDADDDYYPILVNFADGVVAKANRVNSGNHFVNFQSSNNPKNCEFEPPVFHTGTFSETDTFKNLPSNNQTLRLDRKNTFPKWLQETDGTFRQDRVRTGNFSPILELWGTAVSGSGSVTQEVSSLLIASGVTASSSARAVQSEMGLFRGEGRANGAWTSDQRWTFVVQPVSVTTNGQTWIGLYETAVSADPTDRGFGFRIDDLAAKGFAHNGTVLTVTDLNTNITNGQVVILELRYINSALEWWINGTLVGTESTAQLPSGASAINLVVAVANNADLVNQRIVIIQSEHRVVDLR